MRRLMLRLGFVLLIFGGAFAGSAIPAFYFDEPPKAEAQTPVQTAVVSPTATSTSTAQPAATLAPTATATPTVPASPTASATDSSTSTATSTTTGTATATGTASATDTAIATSTSVVVSGGVTPVPTNTPAPPLAPRDISSLPPLATTSEAVGTANDAIVDNTGGTVNSLDGRVQIVFPPGSAGEALGIKITRLANDQVDAPYPDTPLVSLWEFDATAVNRNHAPVHIFAGNITITMHFSPDDLQGREPRSLRFWTLDQTTGKWAPVQGSVDPHTNTITAQINHFTDGGTTATKLVDAAPLMDSRNVDLHTGASALSIPIQVPIGVGGLTPDLSLTYNSERLAEMRQYGSTASWAGIGWDLDVPNIQVSYDPNTPASQVGTPRVFLSMGSAGGEIMPDPNGAQDAYGYIWRARNEQYLRIRTTCVYFLCPFTVWDTKGTKYVFGSDATSAGTQNANSVRWYMDQISANPASYRIRIYRFDLSYSIDSLGNNRVDYRYWQHVAYDANGQLYTRAAYIDQITYNGGDAQIIFNQGDFDHNGWDECVVSYYCLRYDTPRDVTSVGCNYLAPRIVETRRLTQIDVRAGGQLARSYRFTYNADLLPNNFTVLGPPACTPWEGEGTNRLTGFSMTDRNGAASLYTMKFTYTPLQFVYTNSEQGNSYYNWPHLMQVDNGLGGSDVFTYQEVNTGVNRRWGHEVLITERHTAGAGQPDMVNQYVYDLTTGPAEFRYPNPYTEVGDSFNAEYRGFGKVTETDAVGDQTIHLYYTTSGDGDFTTNWNNEVRTGLEYDTTVLDPTGAIVSHAATTWSVLPISNSNNLGGLFVNFVYPAEIDSTTGNGATAMSSYKVNTFDVVNGTGTGGNLVKVDEYAGASPNGTKELTTVTDFNRNTATWVFVPQDEQKLDASGALLNLTRFYYDGANTSTPTTPPSTGLLTAQAAETCGPAPAMYACPGNPSGSSWNVTYSVYDAHRRLLQSSVPTFMTPEGQAAGSSLGWLPSYVASSASTYDLATHPLPTSTTNALGQQTLYQYDWVLQKPTQVSEPNGHVTNSSYDNFGRLYQVSDNFDTVAPIQKFIYTWGTLPNQTVTQQFTTTGNASNYRSIVSCMDGFGREVEHHENYKGVLANIVRTDYDARGMKSVVTNAALNGTLLGCSNPLPAVSGYDRTAYTYDALGNVATTTSIAVGATTGPSSRANLNGTTTTLTDERLNVTTKVQNIGARTLTVNEAATPNNTLLRPTGQGYYQQWAFATPNQAHYLNVMEVAPDDDASQFNDQQWNRKDTQTYPGAGLAAGTTVTSVIFHFRWKQYDSITPNPAGPNMWALFRQASVDTRGPTYQSTNANGWRNDSWTMTTNPRTGQPWSLADVNAGFEFGFEIYPTAGAWNWITQAWVEVVTTSTSTASTVYQYDALGHLTGVTDPAGNHTTINYDMAGRKTGMTDPDMGTWSYAYDYAGNLTSQTDARGQVTTLSYDALNRPVGKWFSNGYATVRFLYDSYPDTTWCTQAAATAVGHMTRLTDASGQQLGCFDLRGRTLQTRRSVDGVNYDTSQTNDAIGQVTGLTYPDGEQVQYQENAYGNQYGLQSVTNGNLQIFSGAWPTPWGAPNYLTLGSGTTTFPTSYTYDYRERLTNISTGASGAAQNLTITYDDASNVTAVADNTGTPETATYSYDQLNRLTSMTLNGGASPSATYAYNSIGNITSKTEGTQSLTLAYPAAGQPRPHAVTSTAGSQALSLTYDANGNLATQGSSTYMYDVENRLQTRDVTGGGAYEYTYDANGTLLKRTAVGAQQIVTLRPNAQGSYSQWNATPATNPSTAHYQNVAETTPDDDTTYIEQSLGFSNDTHLYPSAGVPSNAVIDKVTLKFRWKATGATYGVLIPIFYQGGVMGGGGIYSHVPADGWVNDSWQSHFNPATNLSWTAADVNAGMEFGFRTLFANLTARVTQAWVEVAYRVPTGSTVYIGGLYEKSFNADGTVAGSVKYYQGLGRVVAVRQVPAGGGAGALYYPLFDHLGSTVGMTDSAGNVLATQKYWPYGAVRSGGVSQTDKLYTGQQIENGDSALGLYDYKARFYSTVLGRFVSADSVADGLNRFAYVGNSPVRYSDPTGHCFMGLPCHWDDAQNWLRCALTCGDNWLGDLARLALTTNSFWASFSSAYMSGGRDNVVLFELIATNAKEDTLHVLFANSLGGNYLSSVFGAGWRAEYFEASLSDVLFGTDRVSGLSIAAVEGATDWSEGLTWVIGLRALSGQSHLPSEVVNRLSAVRYNLAMQTLAVAQANADEDLNTRPWSNLQRGWLHDNGFPSVTVPDKETSYWQEFADAALGCGADPTCLADVGWASEWEVEWPYP